MVWVGYDDDRDLNITGAHSALPVWTEFMKRTTGLPIYKPPQPFSQPYGIETAAIDNLTNLVALADPDSTHSEVLIAGTEPFPPPPGAQPAVAVTAETSPGGNGLAWGGDEIVLITDTLGHKVYVNTGAAVSSPPDPRFSTRGGRTTLGALILISQRRSRQALPC